MTRLAISIGIATALMAIAPAARAGSYSFSVGGHRFHVESPRNCRSASCVSVSSRSLRTTEDVSTAPPPPAPVVQAPQPVYPAAPAKPAQATVIAPPPAPPAPVLAGTTSQPVVPPPAPRPEVSRPEVSRPEVPSLNPPRVELSRIDPPRIEAPVVAPRPELKQSAMLSQRSDDEPAYSPLGEWESTGAKGTVRIERCGPALCGFALTEASSRGESVLVNMKPKTHDVWAGSIYSRSSGSTYYGTMTLTSSGKLHVEACAFGHFWCSGNDWTRVEDQQEKVITSSRQLGARS